MTNDATSNPPLTLTVNGERRVLRPPPERVLADLLREDLGLGGVRVACDQGACGACTVLLDGRPAAACTLFAFACDGASVTTIEGLRGAGGGLHPVQRAFVECHAFQCGYCTPGMVLAAAALLAEHPAPDDAAIRAGLAGNICRCTGYGPIIEAVKRAAGA